MCRHRAVCGWTLGPILVAIAGLAGCEGTGGRMPVADAGPPGGAVATPSAVPAAPAAEEPIPTTREGPAASAAEAEALAPAAALAAAANGPAKAPAKAPAGAKAAAGTKPAAEAAGKAAEAARGPKADAKSLEIIEKYLKARGGRKALTSIRTLQVVVSNLKHTDTGSNEAVIRRYMKGPYRIREDWDVKQFQIGPEALRWTQTYDGRKGWVQMFGSVSPLEGKTLYTFLWDKYLDDFFLHWKEDGFSLRYRGPDQVAGTSCEVVEVVDFTKTQRSAYVFDADTGLLVKKQWQAQNPAGRTKNEAYYKEWREIRVPGADGRVRFAFMVEVLEDGVLATERRIQEIRLNLDLPDALFGKPPGKDFTPIKGPGRPAAAKKGGAKVGIPKKRVPRIGIPKATSKKAEGPAGKKAEGPAPKKTEGPVPKKTEGSGAKKEAGAKTPPAPEGSGTR